MTTATRPRSRASRAAPPAAAEQYTLNEMIATPGTYTVLITPQIAEKLLERNTGNRSPKPTSIARFARDMRAGKWRLTNQGLGVDENGVLIDGQNRLMACLVAETPFPTLLSTGLEPEARDVVDTGGKRSFSDVLRMAGHTNVMPLASGAALRYRYETMIREGRTFTQYGSRNVRQEITYEELKQYVRDTASLEAAIPAVASLREAFPSLPQSVIVAFWSMALETDQDAAEEFRATLVSGANLAPRDPRLTLRNFLTRIRGVKRGGPGALYFLCVVIKCWNDWRNGLTRESLKMMENETIPRMDEKPSWAAKQRRAGRS